MAIGVSYLTHVFYREYRLNHNEMAFDLFMMGVSAFLVINTILYRLLITAFDLNQWDIFWRDPYVLTKLMHVGIWFVGLFLIRAHGRLIESSFSHLFSMLQGLMVFIAGWYVGYPSSLQVVWIGSNVVLAFLIIASAGSILILKYIAAVWRVYPPRYGNENIFIILRDFRWGNYFLLVVSAILLILQEIESFFVIPTEISDLFTRIGFWLILFISMALYYFGLMLMLKNDIRIDNLQLATLFSRLEFNPMQIIDRLPPELLASLELSREDLVQFETVTEFKQRLYEKLTQQRQASLSQIIEYMKFIVSDAKKD